MPGTRCVNCRWWNGDRLLAPESVIERNRHGGCERIHSSPAMREDTAARLYPSGGNASLHTRFDFQCLLWEKA